MTPDPDLLWRASQGLLQRYLEVTDNLVLLFLSRDGIILECNRGFVKVADLPGKPTGRPMTDFFAFVKFPFLQQLPDGFCQKVQLPFRLENGGPLTMLGYACSVQGNFLVIGERLALADMNIVTKMTRLHEELLATTRELGQQKVALEQAQANLKVLQGLLPICSCCKKIRDDTGAWQPIEYYIAERTEADFSHSICPECAADLYPTYLKHKPDESEK